MKITPLELKKDLRDFYNSLIVNVFIYFLIVVLSIFFYLSQFMIFLSIFLPMLYAVSLVDVVAKFILLRNDSTELDMNYFTTNWIMTIVDDSKKIKKFLNL